MISPLWILTFIFAIAKLVGYFPWGWIWVFAPLWIPLAIVITFLVTLFLTVFMAYVLE